MGSVLGGSEVRVLECGDQRERAGDKAISTGHVRQGEGSLLHPKSKGHHQRAVS